MAKQTFTTGQVLTAAQVNSLQSNDFNQTVSVKTAAYTLVAADKGTRIEFNTSGSVTCTVNTGLFDAGDTLVIQNRGAGVVTVTAGTATVNTSATLALSQYDAGTLYFISTSAAIFFNTDAGGGSPLTTKGDLYTFSTTDARLAIGANNTVLTADSNEATGMKWAAAGGAITSWSLLNSGGTNLTAAAKITVSFSAQKQLYILYLNASSASASSEFKLRPNDVSTADYTYGGFNLYLNSDATTTRDSSYGLGSFSGGDGIYCSTMASVAGSRTDGAVLIDSADTTGWKLFRSTWGNYNGGNGQNPTDGFIEGLFETSSAITSISFNSSIGNFDTGTIYVFGGN